jgi:hypothetical protein
MNLFGKDLECTIAQIAYFTFLLNSNRKPIKSEENQVTWKKMRIN